MVRMSRLLGRRRRAALLDFEEVRRRLRLGTRVEEGVQLVPVDQIIGSLARAREFDAAFRPLNSPLQMRIAEIRSARPATIDAPISLYRVDHAYFVADGHKRLSLAIADGRTDVEAEVSRFATPYHVAPGVDLDVIRLTAEEERFREQTGLAQAEPDRRFPLSDPGGYLVLAESVKAHAYDLSRQEGRLIGPAEAAGHWLEHVYRPSLEALAAVAHAELMPSLTEADLFLIAHDGNLHAYDPDWTPRESALEHGLANVGRAAGRLRPRRARPRRPTVLEREDRSAAQATKAEPADNRE
jgi:hypothetical protein